MKNTASLIWACLIITGLSFVAISCKKIDLTQLEYKGLHKKVYLEAYVIKKGGNMVLWFQVLDRIDEKDNINSYKTESARVGKYPAKIIKDKSVWLLVNNRIEVRVTADDTAMDFQNTDKLKNFITVFDLGKMEKVTGPKLDVEELEKFIPVLGGK